jgi:hypothetical protein
MAALAKTKTIGGAFQNQVEWYEATWDFAVDGGATGALDIFTADGACIVVGFYAIVDTAVTSGDALTLDLGTTATADLFQADIAVGALTANSVHGVNAIGDLPVRLADTNVIKQTIVAHAATAGKIRYRVGVMKA